MSLADDIRALRERTLVELRDAHNYYANTQAAWELVREAISAGRVLSIENDVTGTVTTDTELTAKSRLYVREHLAEATFVQFLGIFEHFLFELLRLWLSACPKSLGGRKIDFAEVLDAPDKDAITARVVGRELNDVAYKRPSGWFDYLEEKAKLGVPSADEINRIAEAKATRDVIAHNRRIANATYVIKSGSLARYAAGQPVDIPEPYHRKVWELPCKVVEDVGDAAAAKLWRCPRNRTH